MTATGYNRVILSLAVIVAVIVVARAWRVRESEREVEKLVDVAQTYHNGTQLCDGLGRAALNATNVSDVVMCLRQLTPATATPPWGDPPQPVGSATRQIYDMMDRVRALNQRVVISHLRKLTGEDLGDDAMPWIEKYAKLERQP
jgi:hypothetical protein